jgi:lipopolysaccharide transport system ATP-binding protein
MNDIAIRVENLGKQYRIGKRERYQTLRDTLTDTVTAPFRWLRHGRSANDNGTPDHIWALRDLSFEIPRGEVVGIIGRNGAGKSTLLRVLSRITEPTEGWAEIHGRVGSLLEVGTGFHPELTGRENIYLNGAILGMRRAEITRKFDEMVAFAEIEKFLDTPVKHYSSGMYMRLAFAVAAHLEPEILVVDEVLAVGDAAFQKKCLGKMGEVARDGRTVLFVSHNMAAVRSLCSTALWLRNGRVAEFGSTADTGTRYLRSCSAQVDERTWLNPVEIRGDQRVYLHQISVQPIGEDPAAVITVGTQLQVEILFRNSMSHASLNPCMELYNAEDVCVFSSFAAPQVFPNGVIRATVDIPGNLLNDSTYRIHVLIVRDASEQLISQDGPTFEVHDVYRDSPYFGKWIGATRPPLVWQSQVVRTDAEQILLRPHAEPIRSEPIAPASPLVGIGNSL